MKHAGRAALARFTPLLKKLRAVRGLREKSPGAFYVGAAAFLHFHEDPAGIFVDVKLSGSSFQRLPLHEAADQIRLLRLIEAPIDRLQRRTRQIKQDAATSEEVLSCALQNPPNPEPAT